MATKNPDPEVLREYLRYDANTGRLFWNVRKNKQWNTRFANKEAFTRVNVNGYRCGKIAGTNQLAHRVIWAMVNGVWPLQIDHANGQRTDNRLQNLANVTAAENARNKRTRKSSKTGIQGVTQHRKRWCSRLTYEGSTQNLENFTCLGQAINARKIAQKQLQFHVNHGRMI
jgi:hypothetical protein